MASHAGSKPQNVDPAHKAESHGAHHKPAAERPLPEQVMPDLVKTTAAGSKFKVAALVLAGLSVLGVIGVVGRLFGGTGAADQKEWGYVAATLGFMLTVFGGAPMVSVAPSMAKANWIRPVTRISALFSLAGVATALVLLALVVALPPLVTEGARRRSIWFDAPVYSPHFWSIVGLVGLVVTGIGLWYANSLPDFAAMRDHSNGWRQRWGKKLARGFVGTQGQWRSLRLRIGMLGTLYFLVLIFVHFLISTDFAMSMVAGWRDAIFPMYHSLGSLQAGIASTIIAMWAARKWGGLDKYLGHDQFWALGKLLFAFSLLWFYFFISGFIVFWYGRTDSDIMVLDLLIRGPYKYAFAAAFLLCFFLPWWTLIWNRVRASVTGPAVVAAIIIVGHLFDKIRIYGSAWSTDPARIHERFLTVIPQTHYPDVFDIFVIVGAPALGILLMLLASRMVPVVSIWDMKQFLMLSKPVKYMKGHALIVAKPD
ncbi:MAG: hypothetical protein EXR57_01915 [Dehalococcoidia bacterium]|nr:hypothetical protein [Dehalococcoidia bacterium]MSQ34557.1 hypothetical protein [Dehalococcoidia bacterium]